MDSDAAAINGVPIADLVKQSWFHAIDFGDVQVSSNVYGTDLPPNYHLYPIWEFLSEIDIVGKRCLDLGTYDGMTAFVLDRMGADRVDATCQYDLPRFRLAKKALAADRVHYHPGLQIEDMLSRFGEGQFDLVVVSATLHHMTSPQEALFICRRLLKPNGILLLESLVLEGETPCLIWNTEIDDPVFGVPTILLPTRSGLRGLLKFAAFELVAEIELSGGRRARETNYDRVTVVCRASPPRLIAKRSQKLADIHDKATWTGRIDFKQLDKADGPQSTIRYNGPSERRVLNVWSYEPHTPLQPRWRDPKPGRWTQFRLAVVPDFMGLMAKYPTHHWSAKDIYPIAMRYPGEVFPEGQTWTIKQLGNLFCLDHIIEFGLKRVLEMGAGLNLYFNNHLPADCESWMVDSSGFYERDLFLATLARRKRTRFVEGLVGQPNCNLPAGYFDAIFSVSVIEHVPLAQVGAVARHMFDLLTPGGWALHSLDLSDEECERVASAWYQACHDAGLLIPEKTDLVFNAPRPKGSEVFLEALSIIRRFHAGYQENPFKPGPIAKLANRYGSVLIAVRKPQAMA